MLHADPAGAVAVLVKDDANVAVVAPHARTTLVKHCIVFSLVSGALELKFNDVQLEPFEQHLPHGCHRLGVTANGNRNTASVENGHQPVTRLNICPALSSWSIREHLCNPNLSSVRFETESQTETVGDFSGLIIAGRLEVDLGGRRCCGLGRGRGRLIDRLRGRSLHRLFHYRHRLRVAGRRWRGSPLHLLPDRRRHLCLRRSGPPGPRWKAREARQIHLRKATALSLLQTQVEHSLILASQHFRNFNIM